VPLVFEVAVASALYAAVPVKLPIALLQAPDLLVLIGVSGVLLVGWGIVRSVCLVVLRFRLRHEYREERNRS
jgi:hypothetical protein